MNSNLRNRKDPKDYTAVCVYHDNCIDGMAAAMAAYRYYGGEIHLVPASYGDTPDLELMKDKDVYIVDFSYAPDYLMKICEVASIVVWLDHHKTAIEAYNEYMSKVPNLPPFNLDVVLDVSRSGAMLSWNRFNPHRADELAPIIIRNIQDRDLWQFKIPNTREIHAYLSSDPISPDRWMDLFYITIYDIELTDIVAIGKSILQEQNRQTYKVAAGAHKSTLLGYPCYIVSCYPWMFSDVGSLLTEDPAVAFAVMYYTTAKGRMYSLRAKPGFDTTKISTIFGGGGHAGASGFFIPSSDVGLESIITDLGFFAYMKTKGSTDA